jgi:hypothetical protein
MSALSVEHATPQEALGTDLTLEDVPPKSVGGSPLVLTCRPCNSTAGHSYDHAVAARKRVHDVSKAMREKGSTSKPIKSGVELDGVPLNGQLEVVDGQLQITLHGKYNDPRKLLTQQQHIQSGKSSSIRLTPHLRWNERQLRVSSLRSGYLAAFALFGYTYAFHPYLDPIRDQILNPDTDIVPKAALQNGIGDEFTILGMDQPFSGLFVNLGSLAVILPGFPSYPDFYDRVEAAYDENRKMNVSGIEHGWPLLMGCVVDYAVPRGRQAKEQEESEKHPD